VNVLNSEEIRPRTLSDALGDVSKVNLDDTGSLEALNAPKPQMNDPKAPDELHQSLEKKHHAMSNLSIVLTLVSILVAFSISLITIMGLIEDNCTPCHNAAENNNGLSGRWWRTWARANDNSGLIGAAIVGVFVGIVASFYLGKWIYRQRQQKIAQALEGSQIEEAVSE